MRLAIICAPGLEAIVRAEAAICLGVSPTKLEVHRGWLSLHDALPDERSRVYRLSLRLGSASAVVLRAKRFSAQSFKQLSRGVGRVDFQGWLGAGQPLELRVESSKSRLYHTEAIRERVVQGLTTALGGAPAIVDARERSGDAAREGDEPPPPAGTTETPEGPTRLLVRLRHDTCTLSLDPGPTLYRRGYRLATAKAPLRPDYAHALLRAARYDGTTRFGDPLCGSGTLVIEAARIASGVAPGFGRRFAFEYAPAFDDALWQTARHEAAQLNREVGVELIGSDRDAGAIVAAHSNAERAGVAGVVRFAEAALSDSPVFAADAPPSPTWVVTNPPYGERVSRGKSLRPLYQKLGKLIAGLPTGSQAALIAMDPSMVRAMGLGLHEVARFRQGGLGVAFHAATPLAGRQPALATP